MSLSPADIAEIIRLVQASGFDELHLEVGDLKLRLSRGGAAKHDVDVPVLREQVARAGSVPPGAAPNAADAPNVHASDPLKIPVASPLFGVFYRAPKPGAPPFVEVGSTVDDDTIVCIIEVMKLMTTVRAGVRGTVTEIAARDGALVELGAILMHVQRAG